MRLNGLILSESTHEEVVNIMMLKKSLTLNVRCKFAEINVRTCKWIAIYCERGG